LRAQDAADEGAQARAPAPKRARVMEGDARESAQGSVSALEKGEGGGIQARGAGGKGKRQLNVTLTAGGEPPDIAPTDIGRRQEEQELNAAIAATSTAEAAAHQSEGGAGEGRGKRVRKAPKLFGED
jgi:hypothetical protein